MLARVSRMMEQLVHAWDAGDDDAARVPGDPAVSFSNSSGFQSWQYRCIEFSLGNKNAAMPSPHAHRPELLAHVGRQLARTVALRRGDPSAGAPRPAGAAEPPSKRDGPAYAASDAVEQAWLVPQSRRRALGTSTSSAASSPTRGQPSASGASGATTVERVIGFSAAPVAPSGVGYLRKMLDVALPPRSGSCAPISDRRAT